LSKTTTSFVSVRPSAWHHSAPIERIFMKNDVWVFFEITSRKFKSRWKSDKNNGYFTWRPNTSTYQISLNPSYNEKCFKQEL
jgi:hypothetical protein